jgi:hypothetical protein
MPSSERWEGELGPAVICGGQVLQRNTLSAPPGSAVGGALVLAGGQELIDRESNAGA